MSRLSASNTARRVPAFLILATLPFAIAATAQPDEAPNILILQSLDSQTAPYVTITQHFRARLQEYYDSEMVVAFGASELERVQTAEARRDLEHYADRLRFHYTSDLHIGEIEQLVATLPPPSAVLIGILSVDARDLIFPLGEGTERLVAASSVPVFSAFSDELGLGVVGGRQIQLDLMAETMASTAVQLLNDPAEEPVVRIIPLSDPTFDWRALERWDIDTARLPPESVDRFREPSVWSRYFRWILLVAAVIAFQALSIAALLVQRRHRRQAESASTSLSSRLITAHEDESRRIARELHDDVSQRLAGLAIDAAMLASYPATPQGPETLKQMQGELIRISKDVHDMSYRLHPSIVGELGLVAALRAEIDRIRRAHRQQIEERIEPLREPPSPDIALALYRITQECLTNAVKHAGASLIRVRFGQTRRHYLLDICDDGKGFDIGDRRTETGIGLSSMRERARLAGGRLRVSSSPHAGTRIIAKFPVQGLLT
jgi:signal transduction histidine kinase